MKENIITVFNSPFFGCRKNGDEPFSEVQGEEVITSHNKENFHETEGEEFSTEEWLCVESEAQAGFRNSHPWRYTETDYKCPGQHAQTLHVFEQEDELNDLQS